MQQTSNRKKVQELYEKSIKEIENITRFVGYREFEGVCIGGFEARVPIGGIFTEHKYPSISIGFDVKYNISKENGVCITRLYKPRSAGVYKECFI